MSKQQLENPIYGKAVQLLQTARRKVVHTINQTMVETYFEIGKMVFEEDQEGKERAEYGKYMITELSKVLTKEFGKGFSKRNIEQMRQFYVTYAIAQTLSAQFRLSWSHYIKLMRIDDENERQFYEIETAKNNWSIRELQRQYEMILPSKDDLKTLVEEGINRINESYIKE